MSDSQAQHWIAAIQEAHELETQVLFQHLNDASRRDYLTDAAIGSCLTHCNVALKDCEDIIGTVNTVEVARGEDVENSFSRNKSEYFQSNTRTLVHESDRRRVRENEYGTKTSYNMPVKNYYSNSNNHNQYSASSRSLVVDQGYGTSAPSRQNSKNKNRTDSKESKNSQSQSFSSSYLSMNAITKNGHGSYSTRYANRGNITRKNPNSTNNSRVQSANDSVNNYSQRHIMPLPGRDTDQVERSNASFDNFNDDQIAKVMHKDSEADPSIQKFRELNNYLYKNVYLRNASKESTRASSNNTNGNSANTHLANTQNIRAPPSIEEPVQPERNASKFTESENREPVEPIVTYHNEHGYEQKLLSPTPASQSEVTSVFEFDRNVVNFGETKEIAPLPDQNEYFDQQEVIQQQNSDNNF